VTERYCVIVTGSRHLTRAHRPLVAKALRSYAPWQPILLHGDARGADRLASDVAAELWFDEVPMPAQWEPDGRAAGPIRNEAICLVAEQLALCGYTVVVEAFPGPSSRGTWDMVNRAKKRGWQVYVHPVEEAQ
jgi:hypothetical protein